MRCALIEYNDYHEETLPTFVRLLNELDIEPDVYLTKRSTIRDPFGLAPGLRFRQYRADRIGGLGSLVFSARRYELVIVNSMEPTSNGDRAASLRKPILGTMHNTELLTSERSYRDFFSAPNRLPLVLGRHIAKHFAGEGDQLRWVAHVYFGTVERRRREGGPTIFAVSGNVEFTRRNYASLLDSLDELAHEGAAARVRIVGRSTNRDGRKLRAEIERRGLSPYVDLSPAETTHPEFFQLVADSDFVLPLIDHSDDHLQPYFESKLASSIPFATGLGVPLVLHDDLAAAYDVGPCGVRYEDGGLTEAMRLAIASSEAQRSAWRQAILAARQELLAGSLANLRAAIATVVPHAELPRPAAS